jgi:hypothetical protein
LTVPDVAGAVERFEKMGVEVFKPLGEASNETSLVPDGVETICPSFVRVYKQIAMIRVGPSM